MESAGAGLFGAMGVIGILLVVAFVAILGFFLPVFVYLISRNVKAVRKSVEDTNLHLEHLRQEVNQLDQKQARLLQAYQISE